MEFVSNGALVERKAEEIEERALDALEATIAKLVNAMKDLRQATDRFGATLSIAVSTTAQIRSSITELSQSPHRVEQYPNCSVNILPLVASSTVEFPPLVPPDTYIAPHLHFPRPEIPSFAVLPTPSSLPISTTDILSLPAQHLPVLPHPLSFEPKKGNGSAEPCDEVKEIVPLSSLDSTGRSDVVSLTTQTTPDMCNAQSNVQIAFYPCLTQLDAKNFIILTGVEAMTLLVFAAFWKCGFVEFQELFSKLVLSNDGLGQILN